MYLWQTRRCLDGRWSSSTGSSRRTRGGGKLRRRFDFVIFGSLSDMARPTNLKGRNNSEGSVNGPQMSQQSNSSDDSWVTYQSDSSDAFDASFRALALVKNFQGSMREILCLWGLTYRFSQKRQEGKGGAKSYYPGRRSPVCEDGAWPLTVWPSHN